MYLNKRGREFYTLTITTDPQVARWEASFDSGRTWQQGEQVGEADARWLVRGPYADDDPDAPSVLITKSLVPQIRAVDAPEILVRPAPYIILT